MKVLYAAIPLFLTVSGSTLAQNAPGFCQSYAANAAGMSERAIKRNPACLDYSKGVHGDFKMHYDWCMRTPASSVQGAEANIRRLVSACTGNSPQPNRAAVKQFAGTWTWSDRSRGTLPATIEFYPNRQGDARYCYTNSAGRQCFNIRYTVQGNAYVFTNNGVGWFSMTEPVPGVLNGRYWDRRTDVNLPPSANISMRQTRGSRP